MNAFVFDNNTIKVEINGKIFENEAVLLETEICAAKRIINEFNQKMITGEADKYMIEETMSAMVEKIDAALGKNAVEDIMKGKENVSLYDLMDVVIYATECINAFEAGKRRRYNGYNAKNREQRRTQNKR